jgi:hemoglobin
MSESTAVPTLYEWAGGMPAFERLTQVFYDRVPQDPLLAPLFAQMDPQHPQHVARFIAEVFGGPKTYSGEHGGHAAMLAKHLRRHLSEAQRARWMALLLECADAAGLPDDPEFRSAFVGYIEWGTRLARLNSALEELPPGTAEMPAWDWGPVKGPYREA